MANFVISENRKYTKISPLLQNNGTQVNEIYYAVQEIAYLMWVLLYPPWLGSGSLGLVFVFLLLLSLQLGYNEDIFSLDSYHQKTVPVSIFSPCALSFLNIKFSKVFLLNKVWVESGEKVGQGSEAARWMKMWIVQIGSQREKTIRNTGC